MNFRHSTRYAHDDFDYLIGAEWKKEFQEEK